MKYVINKTTFCSTCKLLQTKYKIPSLSFYFSKNIFHHFLTRSCIFLVQEGVFSLVLRLVGKFVYIFFYLGMIFLVVYAICCFMVKSSVEVWFDEVVINILTLPIFVKLVGDWLKSILIYMDFCSR